MKSAIAHLGTQNFPRLRIGIGAPKGSDRKGETISHVLGRFAPEEKPQIKAILKLVVEATEMGLEQGIEKAMSLYNNKEIVSG